MIGGVLSPLFTIHHKSEPLRPLYPGMREASQDDEEHMRDGGGWNRKNPRMTSHAHNSLHKMLWPVKSVK